MAQRGGSVIAQIRYGREIFSPLVELGTARVLGSLERIEGLRYRAYLAPGGLAVINSHALIPVTVSTGQDGYPADAEELNRRAFPRLVYFDASAAALGLGSIRAANTVLLGALSNGLQIPAEAWEEAITSAVRPSHCDLNLEAFALGRSLRG